VKYYHKFLLLIIGLAVFRMCTIHYSYADETIYVSMSKAVFNGAVIYQDFFAAHPPLLLLVGLLAELFGGSLLSLRIVLLTFQILNLVVMNSILKHYKCSENARLLILLLFMLTSGFYHIYNLALGYTTLNLFLLLSFYYCLKKRYAFSVLFAILAIFTRLFALFYLAPMLLLVGGKKKLYYLIPLAALGLFFLLVPAAYDQIVTYHYDSDVGKTFSNGGVRLNMINAFWLYYPAFLLMSFVSRDYRLGLIALFSFFGPMVMKSVFFMYTAFCVPWLVLSSCKDLKLSWLIVLVPLVFASCLIYHYNIVATSDIIPLSDVIAIREALEPYDLPLAGDMVSVNVFSYLTGKPVLGSEAEPAGWFDTAYSRVVNMPDEWSEYLEQDHLFICLNATGYLSTCNLIDVNDYRKIYQWRDVSVLLPDYLYS